MTTFTATELKDIMLSTADESNVPDLDGDFLDVPFLDLDFDSLAVLEIATRVQQEYHLAIPDEAVADLITPRDVLTFVAGQLRESA
jgi:act minimal PKS acyl carrier protein